MNIYSEIEALNDATAKLGAAMGSQGYVKPWSYCGDVNLYHGGTAIRVDRSAMFASVVEATDLGSATGQDGCSMIETGTVLLSGNLRGRNRLRDALSVFGWKASDLLQFDRADRAAEMARAVWVYGARDTDITEIVRFEGDEPDDDDKDCNGRHYMEVDDTVDGESGLVAKFMEYLD